MYDELTPILILGTETRKATKKANMALPATLMSKRSLQLDSPPTDTCTIECYVRNCNHNDLDANDWHSDHNFKDVDDKTNKKWYIYPYKMQSNNYPSIGQLADHVISSTRLIIEWRQNSDQVTPSIYYEPLNAKTKPYPDAKGYVLYCVADNTKVSDTESDDSEQMEVATPSPRSPRGANAPFDLNVYTNGTTIFDVDIQNMPKLRNQKAQKLQTTQNKENNLQHSAKDHDDQDARTCISDINVKENNSDARTCVLTTDNTRDPT